MRIRRSISLVFVLFMVTSVAAAQDWPMFHHDIALSGVTTSRAPATNATLWTFSTGYYVQSSPAIVDGKVYIGNRAGRFFCLDQDTGALIWNVDFMSSIQSSPAVVDGKVYFLSEDGTFHARNAVDGTAVWQVHIGNGSWDWASPAVHGGNVFIASSTGFMYSLNAATGAQNWRTPIGGTPDSPLAIGGGMVFSGTHNFNNSSPTIVAVDEMTGAVRWTYNYFVTHSGVAGMVNSNGAAVVDGDGNGDLELYFGVYNWLGTGPQAVCLDAATGTELWSANVGGNSTSTPAVHNGRVFIGSDAGKLFALRATTGAIAWSYQAAAPIWAAPAVSRDGKVCVGSLDHTMYCVNESDGTLVWSYHTGASRLTSSPALSNGVLFVGNENGNVYAFGARPVGLDIHPTSCPNPINVGKNGVVPVAIVGSRTLDVTAIDLSTIRLNGVAPLRSSVEDVTRPAPAGECGCTTAGADGYSDLTLKFEAQALTAPFAAITGVTAAEFRLTGNLLNGTPIEGFDCVRLQPRGK